MAVLPPSLASLPPPVDPLPPQGPSPSGVSLEDPTPLVEPLVISSDTSGPTEGGDPAADDTATTRRSPRLETPPGFPPRPSSTPLQPVAVDTGAARGGDNGGEDAGGAGPGGAETGGAGPGGAETGDEGSGGADSGGAASPGGGGAVGAPTAGPGVGQQQQLREGVVRRGRSSAGAWSFTAPRAAGPGGAGAAGVGGAGTASTGGSGAGGTGGGAGAGAGGTGGTGGAGAAGPGDARTRGTGATGAGGAAGAGGAGGATGAAGTGGAGGTAGFGGTGAGGTISTGGAGAAGPGGARTRGAGAAGAGGVAGAGGAGGATGAAGTGGAGGTARARGAGDGGTRGTRGAGAAGTGGAAGIGGAGGATEAAGARGAGAAGVEGVGAADGMGTALCRPFFYPQLQLSLPPPDSVQRQPQLLPGSPLPAPTPHTEVTEPLTERREPETHASTPVHARRVTHSRPPAVPGTDVMTLRPSSVPQRFPLPSPPTSSLPDGPPPASDLARAASPTITRLLATVVTDPDLDSTDAFALVRKRSNWVPCLLRSDFEFTAAFALVTELVDFGARSRLDKVASLVTESKSGCPPFVGGEPALSSDVLEDRQFELECLAATLPRFASMLLCLEGDPDAVDIPTPRSYAKAIVGFSQRQRVDFFHTFSPTPKMTTRWVLPHVVAQRDYKLHSFDFSTAFLQGRLHGEIWLRRPPGFNGSFPTGTQ
ncbi:unnamed protein product [Closterium sp. NIES-53]